MTIKLGQLLIGRRASPVIGWRSILSGKAGTSEAGINAKPASLIRTCKIARIVRKCEFEEGSDCTQNPEFSSQIDLAKKRFGPLL